MTVLLDASALAPSEREAAFHAAFNTASKPTSVRVTGPITGTLQAWHLGRDGRLMQLSTSTPEIRLNRAARHLRMSDAERLSVAVNVTGRCVTRNRGLHADDNAVLRLTDLTSTYDISQRGNCRAVAVEIDDAQLRLPVDRVRDALPLVAASPLHDLVRSNLLALPQLADSLDPMSFETVGLATERLVRALLLSVAPRDRTRRDGLAEVLLERIDHFVRVHLADPDLTPARIAHAHSISLRYLYVLFADRAETPAEWIMTLRLEAGRADLARGDSSVAAVARRWAFRSPSHFTRRFKAAFGSTPEDFRRGRGSGGSYAPPDRHDR